MPRGKRRLIGVLRAVILTLIILAIAGLEMHTLVHDQAVAFLLDASRSTLGLGPEIEEWTRQALRHRRPTDEAAVIVFGSEAMIDMPSTDSPSWNRIESITGADHTDIESALRLAAAILPPTKRRRVVLISDGRETTGDARAAAASLKASGIRVDVIGVDPVKGNDVLVDRLDAPSHVHEGEHYDIGIRLQSNFAGQGKLRVFRGPGLISEMDIAWSEGETSYLARVVAQEPGIHAIRVTIESGEDTVAANNEASAIVTVSGRQRALVVEGSSGVANNVVAALKMAGVDVSVVLAPEAPRTVEGWAQHSFGVLVDVPAHLLSERSMQSLEIAVRDLGRGLVMVGGDDSFGPGGYFRTPVERALPVYMDIRGKGEIPSLGLLLVIDKSGSMSESSYGITKMDLAKEAAIRSTEILGPRDIVGVIAFDSLAKWVVTCQSPADLSRIQDDIASIRAGGGTNIYPGLEMAYEALVGQDTKYKHIILMTDGISATTGDYDALVARMREAGITLSSVAVGDDADVGLLLRLSQNGQGRYYFTNDSASVPKIFTKETILASRNYFVDEQFLPRASWHSPLASGLTLVPALGGYVATTLKEAAQAALESHKGEPVLASWQYGLGRSVAWTSDTRGRWTEDWIMGGQMARLWQNIVGWVAQPPSLEGFSVSTSVRADRAQVTLETHPHLELAEVTCRVVRPDQSISEFRLEHLAPGIYKADMAANTPGAYLLQIVPSSEEGPLGSIGAGLAVQYSPEFRHTGQHQAMLEQIAAAGGGVVLQSAEGSYMRNLRPAYSQRALWPLFLGLACVLLVIEVATRKVQISTEDAKSAAAFLRRLVPAAPEQVYTQDATVSRLIGRKRETGRGLGASQLAAASLAQSRSMPAASEKRGASTEPLPKTAERSQAKAAGIDTERLLSKKRQRQKE